MTTLVVPTDMVAKIRVAVNDNPAEWGRLPLMNIDLTALLHQKSLARQQIS
ncbi:MAG: hypothetical protein AAFU71_00780 [Cyanobacteria bacterium J06632_22]